MDSILRRLVEIYEHEKAMDQARAPEIARQGQFSTVLRAVTPAETWTTLKSPEPL
jgi:hypothetical protein